MPVLHFLAEEVPEGYVLLGDPGFEGQFSSAFVRTTRASDTPLSADSFLRSYQLKAYSWISKVRQGIEWGNRSIKGAYPRLRTGLPIANKKRLMLISIGLFLHQLRTRLMGAIAGNQIASVYGPQFEQQQRDTEVEGILPEEDDVGDIESIGDSEDDDEA